MVGRMSLFLELIDSARIVTKKVELERNEMHQVWGLHT